MPGCCRCSRSSPRALAGRADRLHLRPRGPRRPRGVAQARRRHARTPRRRGRTARPPRGTSQGVEEAGEDRDREDRPRDRQRRLEVPLFFPASTARGRAPTRVDVGRGRAAAADSDQAGPGFRRLLAKNPARRAESPARVLLMFVPCRVAGGSPRGPHPGLERRAHGQPRRDARRRPKKAVSNALPGRCAEPRKVNIEGASQVWVSVPIVVPGSTDERSQPPSAPRSSQAAWD